MGKKIPKQFKNIFNSWDEYKDWSIEKARTILNSAFEENENNNR